MAQHTTTSPYTIEVGDNSPLWTGQSNNGQIKLLDCLGDNGALLIFYPADWSNVCSDELPMLEELIKLAGDVRLHAFGISADGAACHKAFARQIGLEKITLISDFNHKITDAYGLLDKDGVCKRATVLIDPKGVVRWIRVEEDRNQPRPLAEMEVALQIARDWSGYSSSLEDWKRERAYMMQLSRSAPLAPPTKLQLRFWGTRGSIPVSGVNYLKYGGNTSCVSLTSDTGHLFVFDCGSGARELGNYLLSTDWPIGQHPAPANKTIEGYILLSHTHWDHIQGFPFFAPVFRPGNNFNILGWSNCSQTLAGILAGQMEHIYFPVSLDMLPSNLSFFSLQYGEAMLDGARVTSTLLKHPLPSTAYRLELKDKAIIYATDHEPHSLPKFEPGKLLGDDVINADLVKLCQDADILIHDAQYSTEELSQKVGWGHNSAEIAVDTCIRAHVKKLVLYHHDPAHGDETIDGLLVAAQKRAKLMGAGDKLEIVAAYDGMELDL
jgi:phosphoribosyl 1,2-cyclic phosphodiesterase/peroxiredoxin